MRRSRTWQFLTVGYLRSRAICVKRDDINVHASVCRSLFETTSYESYNHALHENTFISTCHVWIEFAHINNTDPVSPFHTGSFSRHTLSAFLVLIHVLKHMAC